MEDSEFDTQQTEEEIPVSQTFTASLTEEELQNLHKGFEVTFNKVVSTENE